MTNNPTKQWAYNIISAWREGRYPEKYQHAYSMACACVKQSPEPHPDHVRKQSRKDLAANQGEE